MAELQAGRVDSAIAAFQKVVHDEPANGNAHFQLAALLEDVKKDYLGAIVHYRLYCLIRPDSEKAVVATARLKGCETRYATAAMTKAGVESKLSKELNELQEEHRKCGVKIAKLTDDLEDAKRNIESLNRTVEMKTMMLEKASAVIDEPSVAKAPRKSLRPTDEELLEDDEDTGRRISSGEIKSLRAMLDEDERTANPPPVTKPKIDGESGVAPNNPLVKKKEEKEKPKRLIPETYTVEEGDTLMRISAKFYGTNRKWRDIREANKTVISSDGRVRAGQVIKLP
jgi:LysM repeat protein